MITLCPPLTAPIKEWKVVLISLCVIVLCVLSP